MTESNDSTVDGRKANTPSEAVKNVLFIMCDQLRFDAISCAGGATADNAAHHLAT